MHFFFLRDVNHPNPGRKRASLTFQFLLPIDSLPLLQVRLQIADRLPYIHSLLPHHFQSLEQILRNLRIVRPEQRESQSVTDMCPTPDGEANGRANGRVNGNGVANGSNGSHNGYR